MFTIGNSFVFKFTLFDKLLRKLIVLWNFVWNINSNFLRFYFYSLTIWLMSKYAHSSKHYGKYYAV